jgi:hypothetical protein
MADGFARVRVPVVEVAGEASRAVFLRLGLGLELGWRPLLLLLAAAILPRLAALRWLPDAGNLLPDAIETLATTLCLTAFAVNWAQVATSGADPGPPAGSFAAMWGRVIVATLPLTLAAAAYLALPDGPDLATTPIDALTPDARLFLFAKAGFGVVVWLVMARSALLLPAIARGRPLGWGEAWRMMHGNSWRLVGAAALACVPIILAAQFLLSLAEGGVDHPTRGSILFEGLVNTLLGFVLTALALSAAAGFYRRIVILGRA